MPEFNFGSLLGCDDKPKEKPKRRDVSSQNSSEKKNKLKLELRKLVEALNHGHKKYSELGFSSILEAKARIHEIIDKL